MNNINKMKYISQQEIKKEIHKYIEKELNSNKLIETLSPATINIVENIASGAASFMIYNAMVMKNERFLSTAKLDSSIFALAKDYSYNISRAVSPKLELIYNSTDTIQLKEGEILGEYENQQLIYFGKPTTIEKGDKIEVSIGKLFTITENAKLVSNSLKYDLEPRELTSIDNTQIKIYVNKTQIKISKLVEDFAVWGNIVDFSTTNTSTRLMVCDNQFKYGKTIFDNDLIEIKYIETDGYLSALDINELKVNEHFLINEILTLGTRPEPVEKIRELAPLFYSTQRRMVNEKDHIYIATSSPFFKSVGYKKDGGKPLRVRVRVTETDKDFYTIYIDQQPYTYVRKETDGASNIVDGLIKLIKVNSQVETKADKDAFVFARDSRNETEIEVSEGLEKFVIQENKKPPCCTVFLYYIKHNTTNEPITLTMEEENEVADYLEQFKFEGVRIVLLPASKISKDISISVKVRDSKYSTQVTEAIQEILSDYELKLHQDFKYGEFIARAAKIEILDLESKELVSPVEYILPKQEVFDIVESADNYIKFDAVNISYIKEI